MTKIFKQKSFYFFLILYFVYIFLISFNWELIKLPFNNQDEVIGYLTINKINPLNDTLRFFLFVGPPFVFTFFYIRKYLNLNFFNIKLFFKKDYSQIENVRYRYYFCLKILFFIFIILEFFSINFSQINSIDTLHDGDYLTPLINYQNYKGFWTSSFTIHGGRELFTPIIASKIFDTNNFGAIKFSFIFLIFIIKFFSIIISYQFIKFTKLESCYKLIIFVISTFFLLSLSSYTKVGLLNTRDLFVLINFIIMIEMILKKNTFLLSFLLSVSVILALFFHYDTGLYLVFLFFVLNIYFVLNKKFKDFFFLTFTIFINLFLVFLLLEKSEFLSFFDQLIHAIKNIDKIHGLEYPKPFNFSEIKDSSRGTKLLIFFLLLGFFVNFSVFLKNNFLITRERILIIFIYLYSLISFKNALGRSDAAHMMLSSDWVTILLFYYFIFALFFFISLKFKFSKKTNPHIILCSIIIAISVFRFYDLKFLNFEQNLKDFINKPIIDFVGKETNNDLNKLSDLLVNDNCINNFTTNLSLPYVLNKPTCSPYFSSWLLSGIKSETLYISYLKKKKSRHIIYNAPALIVDGIPTYSRLKKVDNYIKQNYSEIFNHNNYVVYELKF